MFVLLQVSILPGCAGKSLQGLNNSGQGGCYNTDNVKVESSEPVLRVNSSLMVENSSYFITVFVTKDQRQAEYTQEVYIVPGDPPEVNIRYINYFNKKKEIVAQTVFEILKKL